MKNICHSRSCLSIFQNQIQLLLNAIYINYFCLLILIKIVDNLILFQDFISGNVEAKKYFTKIYISQKLI